MNPHNPANIDPSLVGPNHRLLNIEELSKPLPEGAEYWDSPDDKWIPSYYVGSHLTSYNRKNTYRIPLTLRDRLEREIEERTELLKVVEAVEKGAEWEAFQPNDGFQKPRDLSISNLTGCIDIGLNVRLKPTPHTIPWTLDSHPDVVWVKEKTWPQRHYLVTAWNPQEAYIENVGWRSYQDLHDHWQQRSGEVCGERVTA